MSDDKICRMIELARGHMDAGGVNAAGVYYRMILKDTTPPKSGIERVANGEACLWHARKAKAEGMIGAACDWYTRATEADPRAADYRIELCREALVPMGLFKFARTEATKATKIEPTSKDAWSQLAKMEHTLGNVTAAIAAYDKAIELAPDDDFAQLDRATIAIDTADYKTARKHATSIGEDNDKARADAMHLLAMCDYREGKHEEAIKKYRKAIALGCYDPKLAEWNMSLAMHSIGDYRRGWKHHEARGHQKTDAAMSLLFRRFSKPMWNGEPAPARLHLHQEMGFGDAIAMARYIPVLLERGYEICCEVNESLVELFRTSFPQADIVAKAADYPGATGLKDFDYHVPMLSLPAIMGTDIDSVPWNGPYLKTDRPVLRGRKPRIGLCWSSGVRQGEGLWLGEYGRRKSMKFDDLTLVMCNAHCDFVSLQVGQEQCQLEGLPDNPTWDDTAALVASLDLVITVDTSVAHLAGAMGVPVWVMMHTEGSWHWMTKRADSPWYPTAKLYRQDKPYQWGGVIERIENDLRLFAAKAA